MGKNEREVESGYNTQRLQDRRGPPGTAGDRLSESETQPETEKSKSGPVGFDAVRKAYPKRAGSHRWVEAEKAYSARLKSGVKSEDILAGVLRYAAYIKSTGKEGTQYVLQAATFFGPSEHSREDWKTDKVGPKQVDPLNW